MNSYNKQISHFQNYAHKYKEQTFINLTNTENNMLLFPL